MPPKPSVTAIAAPPYVLKKRKRRSPSAAAAAADDKGGVDDDYPVFGLSDLLQPVPDRVQLKQRACTWYRLSESGKRVYIQHPSLSSSDVASSSSSSSASPRRERGGSHRTLASYFSPKPLSAVGGTAAATTTTTTTGGNDELPRPGIFRRTAEFEVPPFLTEEVWRRHGYSLRDIKRTIQDYRASNLWPLSLLDHQSVATNAVKVSYASEDALICGARATAVKNTMQSLERRREWPTTSVLRYAKCRHKPKLPVHHVDEESWTALYEVLMRRDPPPRTTKVQTTLVRYRYDRAFCWRGIQIVPFQLVEPKIMLVTRIVRTDEYFSQCQKPKCLTQDPRRFVVEGTEYCSTMESFYMLRTAAPASSCTLQRCLPISAVDEDDDDGNDEDEDDDDDDDDEDGDA